MNGLVEKAPHRGLLAVGIIFLFLRSLAGHARDGGLAADLASWRRCCSPGPTTLRSTSSPWRASPSPSGAWWTTRSSCSENSYRYVQDGYDPEEAALKGATEVASAITSSTLTTTAVFLPLGLVGGIVEQVLPAALPDGGLRPARVPDRLHNHHPGPHQRLYQAPREARRASADEAETRAEPDEGYDGGRVRRCTRAAARAGTGAAPACSGAPGRCSWSSASSSPGPWWPRAPGCSTGCRAFRRAWWMALDGIADAVRGAVAGVDTGSPVFLVAAGRRGGPDRGPGPPRRAGGAALGGPRRRSRGRGARRALRAAAALEPQAPAGGPAPGAPGVRRAGSRPYRSSRSASSRRARSGSCRRPSSSRRGPP